MVHEVLDRAERLDLPDWYLAAGCLFQTVWNVLDGAIPSTASATTTSSTTTAPICRGRPRTE